MIADARSRAMSDTRNDPKPKPAHADLVWAAAVTAAKHMSTVTYGEITQPAGLGRGLSIRYALGYIETACRRLGWPPLNVVVVNAEKRRPGSWVKLGEPAWRALVLAVYAFPWDSVSLPASLPEEVQPTEGEDE
jgi:hypothetical protein